jgi:DNA replication and repair protein RecF
LLQRAALLRRIRDDKESPHALRFWDDQLATLAVPIMRERSTFIEHAAGAAARIFAVLARSEEDETEDEDESVATFGEDMGDLRLVYRPSYDGPPLEKNADMIADMRARLGELRRREIAQGANVLGPHRDDLAFLAGGVDISIYGSRGQQRSVALALKLAELEYIENETGDQPILLLDDVLSELDGGRRRDFLEAVRPLDQVLLTTTDSASLPGEVLAYAHRYRVRSGHVFEQI